MKLLNKFFSRYSKNKITLMKQICEYFVDNIINTLDQHDDIENKKMKLIEVYFFVISFIEYNFFLNNNKTYTNNFIFERFLMDIIEKVSSIYQIDTSNIKKAKNEFLIHYNDRKSIYISSFFSDLKKHNNIFSDTICDFILHLYEDIDYNTQNKLKMPFALQLTELIATCSDRL